MVLHFSSEDELDFTIHCATQKGLRVRHSSVSSKGSSAESDFEKEMNEELNQRVSALEEARKTGQISKGNSTVLSALVNHEKYTCNDVWGFLLNRNFAASFFLRDTSK